MRALLAMVVATAASGCLRDTALPPEPGAAGCLTDSQCEFGLCDSNHTCDKNQCRADADCESQVCVGGATDKVGRCGASECKTKEDCGWSKRCQRNSTTREATCVPGCAVDAECRWGLCEADQTCNTQVCHASAQCESMLCILAAVAGQRGRCGYFECKSDSDCANGNKCTTLSLTGETFCVSGCRTTADCLGACDTCAGGSPTAVGACIPGAGPPLVGDPAALKMTDNLASAASYVRAKNPGAFLTQINGAGLKGDGTVDITSTDYSPRWMYGFQLGDGSTAPPTMLTVTFYKGSGVKCGLYDGNAGNISPKDEIPDTQWSTFKDATELVTAFKAQPNCVAPQATSSDYIIYLQDTPAPRFLFGNWKSQGYIGNPITGVATATCPP